MKTSNMVCSPTRDFIPRLNRRKSLQKMSWYCVETRTDFTANLCNYEPAEWNQVLLFLDGY